MTLYLTYRPQTIDDLDLKAVRDSLKATLGQIDIPHAFLFAGPKGTGKTSAARIVAKAINCEKHITVGAGLVSALPEKGNHKGYPYNIEPCNKCASCISITRGENMDVIEIDAASHRGIDDIRMLRDAVKLAPTSSSKKIYIIDEAHMLTTEACNALLKVLEEPPVHVIFILATTNPEKLIDTIRSRTRLIQFTKATEDDVVRRLQKIAKGEKVDIGDDVLKLIAHASDGAFRDGVKIFEQLISGVSDLTPENVSEYLFGHKSFDPDFFLQKLFTKDTKGALELIEHGISQGVSAKGMAKGTLDNLRKQMIENIANGKWQMANEERETVKLLELFSKAYTEIPTAYLEQLPLEIAVVKYTTRELKDGKTEKQEDGVGKSPKVESAPAEGSKFKVQNSKLEKAEERQMLKQVQHDESSDKEQIADSHLADTVIPSGLFSDEVWSNVLSDLRPKNAATEALLRACKPMSFNGKVLTVGVFYKFHKERLESHPHRDLLEESLATVLGSTIRVSCTLAEPPAKKIAEEIHIKHEAVLTEAKNDDIILRAAKDIFGS